MWQWFWDNVLGPIASWTGGIFLTIWDGINGALQTFAQWCADNPGTVQAITAGIVAFFGAWKTADLVGKIGSLIGKITGAGGLMGALGTLAGALGPGGMIALAIATAIAAGIWLYQNWDKICEKATELKDWLLGKWEAIKTAAGEKFAAIKKAIEDAWELMRRGAYLVWNKLTTFLSGIWDGFVTTATTVWASLKKAIGDAWELIRRGAETVWNKLTKFLGGIWDGFVTTATTVFESLKKAISDKWTLITTTAESVWKGISTFLGGIWNGFVATVTGIFGSIVTKIGDAWDAISTAVTNVFGGETGIVAKVKGFFGDIKDNILGIFTGEEGVITKFGGFLDDLVAKVTGIKEDIDNAFAVVFGGIVNIVRLPINAIIGFINNMVTGVIDGINRVIYKLNTFGFSLPEIMGGGWVGFNITPLSYPVLIPEIPALAKGAVIPPNAPFMAMLGDQRHGTNVEAPLETIQQAVANVIGSGGDQHITIYLDGKVVYENVLKRGRDQQIWSGHNPFELA
jgi:phage-related protein